MACTFSLEYPMNIMWGLDDTHMREWLVRGGDVDSICSACKLPWKWITSL